MAFWRDLHTRVGLTDYRKRLRTYTNNIREVVDAAQSGLSAGPSESLSLVWRGQLTHDGIVRQRQVQMEGAVASYRICKLVLV